MTATGSRSPGRLAAISPIGTAVLAVALLGAAPGCTRGGASSLGPADGYLLLAPEPAPASGVPAARELPLEEARAARVHKLLADHFGSEIVRTDYLAKQLVRNLEVGGRRFPDAARAVAELPTLMIVDGERLGGAGVGLALRRRWGRDVSLADAPWLGLSAQLEDDKALMQTISGKLGRLAAARVALPEGPTPAALHPGAAGDVLVEAYAWAMEVIGREWRFAPGPQGRLPIDAGTREQRERFAGVRENVFVRGEAGLRPPADMMRQPGVAAAVLYRLAEAKGVGHKVAPAEIYAPFAPGRLLDNISPAAMLGPFRNFQAKLLHAWGRAVLEGRAPHDIIDLVEAYGRLLPAEKSEAFRILVITTFGATLKAGGVAPDGKPEEIAAELTALAAEAAAGRRGLRDAMK